MSELSKYVELVKEGKVYEATLLVKQMLTNEARQVVKAEMLVVAEECGGMKKESEDEESEEDSEDEDEDEESEDDKKD